MKKIKVSEATNIQLDWLVAKCEHGDAVFLYRREPLRIVHKNGLPIPAINDPDGDQFALYLEYTTDPSQMWPIIEREMINPTTIHDGPTKWAAYLDDGRDNSESMMFGPTLLIAAARCFVVSCLGETAEMPDDL